MLIDPRTGIGSDVVFGETVPEFSDGGKKSRNFVSAVSGNGGNMTFSEIIGDEFQILHITIDQDIVRLFHVTCKAQAFAKKA